jgi:hypothetical protein
MTRAEWQMLLHVRRFQIHALASLGLSRQQWRLRIKPRQPATRRRSK